MFAPDSTFPLPVQALSILPEEPGGWIYYGLCALFFTLCGLCCGYFVWRKGHMQMLEAEMEVKRTEDELKSLRHDMSLEEQEILDPASKEDPVEGLLSNFGEKDGPKE
ncbi:MAG: hypothetical protein CMO55_08235 [Verrucomicrobiales bacterium]|nr:hypothetical protein [Verrucomicrobiales bacterium]